jgi:CubicO group peptidase (beta-lactamase class C family)
MHSLRITCAVVLIMCFAGLLSSAACQRADSPRVSPRGDRFDGVRARIEKTLAQPGAASGSIAAAKDGKIVWEESFGWADKEKRIAATPHSMYPLASITKALTATGLMVLVERGRVALARPANDYLGEAKMISFVGDPAQASVRHVLLHTAGLPTHANLFPESGAPQRPSQDESIRRYGIIVDEPGRAFCYSNFGYGVLDRIIAAVSGRSYADFMKLEVFEPLGMTHTSVLVDPPLSQHAVQNYSERGEQVPRWDSEHRGASLVYSSAHDLIRFAMFHLKDRLPGQKQVLSNCTLDLMHQPSDFRVPDEAVGEVRVGLGWAVIDLLGYRFISTTGGMPGTVTRLALIPDQNAAVAVLANSDLEDAHALWEIEWATFAALIGGFPEKPKIPEARPDSVPLPGELKGEWTGTVKTYEGQLPARLTIGEGREILLEINGRTTRPIPLPNPLGALSYKDGTLSGPFFGQIPTTDAQRLPHVLFLRLRLRGGSLSGFIATAALNRRSILPHWIELKRNR